MLRKIATRKKSPAAAGRFAIVAARYNSEYTDALTQSAQRELAAVGAQHIEIIRVPGSFEIPAIAARLARSKKFDVIICFGAILRGATTHADNIADAVSAALAHLQIQTGVPIIHGVLLFENHDQARQRCLGSPDHNRGLEAARTALEMCRVVRELNRALGERTRPRVP